MNDRDTHFLGFARLVMKDLLGNSGYIDVDEFWDGDTIAVYEEIIANRAYDLLMYSLEYTQDEVYHEPEDLIRNIPDLTEWPKNDNAS